jgi:hypothetical protein
MSAGAIQPGDLTAARAMRLGEDNRGYRWVVFAGAMLTLAGTLNLIDGISAVAGSNFFLKHTNYIIGDLSSLGWAVMLIGVVQLFAGFGVLAKIQAARWIGIVAAALNGVVQLLLMPAYPFWSLAVFALDIVVMHGLIVYGGRTYRPV